MYFLSSPRVLALSFRRRHKSLQPPQTATAVNHSSGRHRHASMRRAICQFGLVCLLFAASVDCDCAHSLLLIPSPASCLLALMTISTAADVKHPLSVCAFAAFIFVSAFLDVGTCGWISDDSAPMAFFFFFFCSVVAASAAPLPGTGAGTAIPLSPSLPVADTP